MDRLKTCVDALRILARQPRLDVNRLALAEQRIKEYLQGEPQTSLTLSLKRLATAINNELDTSRGDKDFWITVQEFVERMLRNE